MKCNILRHAHLLTRSQLTKIPISVARPEYFNR